MSAVSLTWVISPWAATSIIGWCTTPYLSSSRTGCASGHRWQRQQSHSCPSNPYLREPQSEQDAWRRWRHDSLADYIKADAWLRANSGDSFSSMGWIIGRRHKLARSVVQAPLTRRPLPKRAVLLPAVKLAECNFFGYIAYEMLVEPVPEPVKGSSALCKFLHRRPLARKRTLPIVYTLSIHVQTDIWDGSCWHFLAEAGQRKAAGVRA